MADRLATVGAVSGLCLVVCGIAIASIAALLLGLRADGEPGTIGAPGAAGERVGPGPVASSPPDSGAPTKGISITEFGARCDGKTDDTAALKAGIAGLRKAGGTLVIPPRTCLIRGSHIRLGNVSITGTGGRSVLALTGRSTIMQVDGSNVRLSRMTLVHSGDQNTVMFLFSETAATGIEFHEVTLDGGVGQKSGYSMGLWLSHGGEYRDISISNSTLTGFTYAVGINSNFSGVLDGVTIENSSFHGNYGDDVEINTPAGTSRNISIVGNTFRDNRASHERAGFGVGLANAGKVVIKNNTFSGYPITPIHIEDRSFDIAIEGNAMSSGSTAVTGPHSSYIFIINGTRDVRIDRNVVDASANVNPTFCVYVGPGGGPHGAPVNITGSGNTFTACRGFNGHATYGDTNLTNTVLQ